jgi:hypothetical protein
VSWINTVSEVIGTVYRASAGIKIAVNQDNIMEAVRIIESEAEHFRRQVNVRRDQLHVYQMGGDPVSAEVARTLTEKFYIASDSYVSRCLQYATMLDNLARQLCESAQTYGFTEEQAAERFNAAKHEGHGRPLELAQESHYGGLRAN